MIVKSNFKSYKVCFAKEFDFLKKYFYSDETFFVLDSKVYNLYQHTVFDGLKKDKFILLDAEESNKNIKTVLDICEEMTKLDAKRNIHLISVGGGIVQDITGVVANLLYRGICWTFVPTTLLSSCDSCIGGKTSLNYKTFKNLLGTFYPPDSIIICPLLLKTLTENDFKSGLGEVVKFNIMYGEEGIKDIEENIDMLLKRDNDVIVRFILKSLEFKKSYIEKDEFDRGIRIHLNFAHTFGHAIESVTHYDVPHGTTVAMGTIVANYISYSRNYLHEDVIKRMEALLRQIIPIEYDISGIDTGNIIEAIRKDKKQTNSNIKAVLFDENMSLKVYEDIQKKEIQDAFEYLKEFLGR